MSFSILLAAFSLVLIGLLFGFNIQVDNSLISIVSSIGTFVSAMAAAAAAYFSYRSIGQWRDEAQHSLSYNHFNDLEIELTLYIKQVRNELYSNDEQDFMQAFRIAASSSQEIRDKYENLYQKIFELVPVSMHAQLKTLELSTLIYNLHTPIIEYKSK